MLETKLPRGADYSILVRGTLGVWTAALATTGDVDMKSFSLVGID